MEKIKIKSIIPANGVTAVFSNGDNTGYEMKVVFWAIIEKRAGDEIYGFIAGESLENVEDIPGFIRYETE